MTRAPAERSPLHQDPVAALPPVAERTGTYPGTVFFIIGIDTKLRHLGDGATRECPRCHNTTQWLRMRSFRQLTLFFVIPVLRWRRRQYETCGICGAVIDV